jgi:hypothetical protein
VHLVGADVLRNPTRFTGGDLRDANGIEERGLSVVDMPHHRHDRRAADEIGRVVDDFGLRVRFFDRVNDAHGALELFGDQLDCVV